MAASLHKSNKIKGHIEFPVLFHGLSLADVGPSLLIQLCFSPMVILLPFL